MQNVSTAWKTAQGEALVPESYIEIAYRVGELEAQFDASATDNGSAAFANTAQTVDNLDKTYAAYGTGEINSWILDGTRAILSDAVTEDTGFVSSVLSGADGKFAANPVITIGFTKTYTEMIPGISIRWSEAFDECATGFVVSVYNGATLIATKTVTDNIETLSVALMDIAGYNKIVVEITEWCLPHCRARIEEIVIGAISVFRNTDLLGFEHSQAVDLLSADLPKAHIVFGLHNVEGQWNPDNPQGLWKYLLERQEIVVRYGYRIGNAIEWIKAGTFYMSEWDTPSNGISAQFTARDLLEFMQGDFVVGATTLTLYALAEAALVQSGLPLSKSGGNRWVIDNALSAIAVTLPEEFEYTRAEVVQLCANAACCVMYQDRDGVLRIEPLATVLTDYVIGKYVSYANAEYEINKELKSVDVNTGMGAAAGGASGEVQTVENPLIQNGAVANAVAAWVRDCIMHRKQLSGEYRADPRLDALDKVIVENKYATNAVFITSVKYSYGGAFRGEYEGRVVA